MTPGCQQNVLWRRYESFFDRDTWKEIMKNNLMSCCKYSHWDPFMDVNPKYHWQGVRLCWKIQCSTVGFWCHPWQSSINDVIEHCKYLTLAKNYFYCASDIDLSTDCQLIHVSRPVIAICARVEQGGWLWGQMGWRYISYYPWETLSLSCLFLPVLTIRVSGAFKWRSQQTEKVFCSGQDSDASFTSLKKVVFEEGFPWERPDGAS